jgi:hypothetical protein
MSMAVDTGKIYIPAEFKIFGDKSTVYNRTSEITETKPVNFSNRIVKSWISAGLVLYLLLLFFALRRLLVIQKMVTDYRFAKKQYEETSWITTSNIVPVILFTIVVVSVQYSLWSDYQEFAMIIIPILLLSGIFMIQSASLKLLGLVCRSENVTGEVRLNRSMYMSIVGIIISPLVILALLYEGTVVKMVALIASEVLLGILVLLMLIRLSKVFSEAKISYLFRFLYLCVFEISPYLAAFIVFENIS